VSLQDPDWSGFGVEAYLFVSLVYFVFCYAMSRYARTLETRPLAATDAKRRLHGAPDDLLRAGGST
jgi:hypothetical protein